MPSFCKVVSKIFHLGGQVPPTELGYIYFPCTSYRGDHAPSKYRAALRDLEENDYTLARPGFLPPKLEKWGCEIRINVRTDRRLKKQTLEIKRKARRHLNYLLQHALDHEAIGSDLFELSAEPKSSAGKE